jgi:HD-GYP domain-containing protein (c-di-GMP phosphodiesterase class II)
LEQGAFLHDVGKIGISDTILLKPGPLTEDEWVEMRRHPVLGYQLLSAVPFLKEASVLVLNHHERFDGSGYPAGLTGEAIPLPARIFAVVDAYDALTSDRPYREARPQEEAVAELRRGAGTYFDPRVVEAFVEMLAEPLELAVKSAAGPA